MVQSIRQSGHYTGSGVTRYHQHFYRYAVEIRIVEYRKPRTNFYYYRTFVKSVSSTLHRQHTLAMVNGYGLSPCDSVADSIRKVREDVQPFKWHRRMRKWSDKDVQRTLNALAAVQSVVDDSFGCRNEQG